MTYLNGSPRETDAAWLCRTKARGCQRAALTTIDHNIRLRYLHLAKLWHEMAREAERKANCYISERDAQHGPAGVVAGLFSASPLCALFPSPRKRLAKP